MTRPALLFLWLTTLCAASTARAEPAGNGLGRLHGIRDWVVGCDNTRACEAQGYGVQDEDHTVMGHAALIVRREAGPGRLPAARFAYGSIDDAAGPTAGDTVAVQAGRLRFRLPAPKEPGAGSEVPDSLVAPLLAAALKADRILLSTGTKRWSVSLSGAAAALLKMDDLQGRVGTAGALVRRGDKPEPEAPVVPSLRPVRLPATTAADRALERAVRAALPGGQDGCPDAGEGQARGGPIRLDTHSLLVAQACFQGAYQTGSRLWRVDDQPPFRAKPVLFPMPDGTRTEAAILELLAVEGGRLSVNESAKARGIGDCWAIREWTWEAGDLVLVSASESPCKLFEAGGLPIQLWRTPLR